MFTAAVSTYANCKAGAIQKENNNFHRALAAAKVLDILVGVGVIIAAAMSSQMGWELASTHQWALMTAGALYTLFTLNKTMLPAEIKSQ